MIWLINVPLLALAVFAGYLWGWRRGIEHSIKAIRRYTEIGGRL
jgi:hypothetical protein